MPPRKMTVHGGARRAGQSFTDPRDASWKKKKVKDNADEKIVGDSYMSTYS